jgi:hypothetical protein
MPRAARDAAAECTNAAEVRPAERARVPRPASPHAVGFATLPWPCQGVVVAPTNSERSWLSSRLLVLARGFMRVRLPHDSCASLLGTAARLLPRWQSDTTRRVVATGRQPRCLFCAPGCRHWQCADASMRVGDRRGMEEVAPGGRCRRSRCRCLLPAPCFGQPERRGERSAAEAGGHGSGASVSGMRFARAAARRTPAPTSAFARRSCASRAPPVLRLAPSVGGRQLAPPTASWEWEMLSDEPACRERRRSGGHCRAPSAGLGKCKVAPPQLQPQPQLRRRSHRQWPPPPPPTHAAPDWARQRRRAARPASLVVAIVGRRCQRRSRGAPTLADSSWDVRQLPF